MPPVYGGGNLLVGMADNPQGHRTLLINRLLHLGENAAQRRAQRFRYSGHVYQCNVARSPFDITDISPMYSCELCQLLL